MDNVFGKCDHYSVTIMASGTIMAIVTYDDCNLCKVLLFANILWQVILWQIYGKSSMANVNKLHASCNKNIIYNSFDAWEF